MANKSESLVVIYYNGNEYKLSQQLVNDLFSAKVLRTATIIKNVRERADGSLKDLATMALDNNIIEPLDAFKILAEKDKEVNAENKKKLIEILKEKGLMNAEKTDKPTEDDLKEALAKVLVGKGQNDF